MHTSVNKLIAAEKIKVFKGTYVYVMIMFTMSCKMQLTEKVCTEAQTVDLYEFGGHPPEGSRSLDLQRHPRYRYSNRAALTQAPREGPFSPSHPSDLSKC